MIIYASISNYASIKKITRRKAKGILTPVEITTRDGRPLCTRYVEAVVFDVAEKLQGDVLYKPEINDQIDARRVRSIEMDSTQGLDRI